MGLNLKNRKVVITGASDGIGRALALAFAKEGAQVIKKLNENKIMGKGKYLDGQSAMAALTVISP